MVGRVSISQARADVAPWLRGGGFRRGLGIVWEDIESAPQTSLTQAHFSSVIPDPVHAMSLTSRGSHAMSLPMRSSGRLPQEIKRKEAGMPIHYFRVSLRSP